MQYQVFVQNDSVEHFIASIVGMPNLSGAGKTEASAIAQVAIALEQQLANGKFVTIDVDETGKLRSAIDPFRHAGIFEEDPTFDDWMEKMAQIRQDANAVDDWV